MRIKTSLDPTIRIFVLALVLVSIPVIFVVDVCFTPWRVPTRILYAIPIMVAARLLASRPTAVVILLAIAFSTLDAWMVGIEWQTEVLSLLALVMIGLLSVLWAHAERRSAALGEERTRFYEREQRRTVELEESHSRLLEFFSMVAHDLRNPLAIISAFGQMLPRWESLPSERRTTVTAGVKSSIRQITRLSQDLTDASHIGSGRFEINKGPCDLIHLSRELVEQRQPGAPNHRLILDTQPERLESQCDADRIAQVIGNLLDNAIKYSPQGGEVRVRIERNDDRVRLAVSDQGIGIGPEDIPRLFQPYARLKRAQGIKGLGLGLYIVQGIVEAHGGTITVQSDVGKGSTFIIDLPLENQL